MSDSKFVDNDWKQRAEEEKKKIEEKYKEKKAGDNLPPASFATLMSTFATQAMVALGDLKFPGLEGKGVDLENARYAIDTLAVIQEKTQGNLSAEEDKGLKELLQSLRLRYVQKTKEDSPIKTPDPNDSPIIQTPDQAKGNS